MPMPIPMPYTPTPMPMPVPMPTPGPMPMPMPVSGLPCENCSCRACQDKIDEAACRQSRQVSKSCWDYNRCYDDKNETLYRNWQDICNRQLEELRLQWYGVMRVECLVYALNTSDSLRPAAIDRCRNSRREDYDFAILSSIWLKECEAYSWPEHVAATDPMCEGAKDPYTNVHMSGVEVYEDYWYSGFTPGNCVSDCCFPSQRPQVVPTYRAPDGATEAAR
eukprot:TRINITY_DN4025_c3_g1_i1.p1 TRINITY_DN4025_c3_g1~~TRINITY_DN4025_c3_g1_i1.p1  ORF type:complete len:221 (+),score=29.58 TRINITY_DN4025_c3_g1_i1:2-664(+)